MKGKVLISSPFKIVRLNWQSELQLFKNILFIFPVIPNIIVIFCPVVDVLTNIIKALSKVQTTLKPFGRLDGSRDGLAFIRGGFSFKPWLALWFDFAAIFLL